MWHTLYARSIARQCSLQVSFRTLTSVAAEVNRNAVQPHVPVLLRETISALNVRPGQIFVDMTFGAGGHTRAILERGGRVVAIDRDPSVKSIATDLKKEFPNEFDFRTAKFTDIRHVLNEVDVRAGSVAGMVFDCGCSSMQMDQEARGFSASNPDGPLDMRMNPNDPDSPSAAQLVNSLSAYSLARIFKVYGEEKRCHRIANAIIAYRYEMKVIRTTGEFCRVVDAAFSDGTRRTDMLGRPTSNATKAMMALRIFVNDELNQLNHGLRLAADVVMDGGRVAVLSFHSLEDRIVKRHFAGVDMSEPISHSLSQKYRNAAGWHQPEELVQKWLPVFQHAVQPTEDEIERNPRSRSAKLRAALRNMG
ncbi:putative methyltransferase protein 15-like [Tropilaelaps mercedesae]|uniref:Putative methyltransferase protein 15-like n=1 Tax=Tropilaelaps mercedesae TaxID=418985 RepID=A0A1V9X0V9_9ACAR|nr:putative methyltransferase protein 15-like [Tropilaelaps mercedesae]